MKDVSYFLLFLTYIIGIFFLPSFLFLLPVLVLNIGFLLIKRIGVRDCLKNLVGASVFILLTTAINLLLDTPKQALLVAAKLFLVWNSTYLFSKIYTPMRLAKTIETLCSPLKIMKVDPKDIGMMIAITFAFIPILKEQLSQIRDSLKAKGINIKINNLHLIAVPLLSSTMQKITDMEFSLKAKGYQE